MALARAWVCLLVVGTTGCFLDRGGLVGPFDAGPFDAGPFDAGMLDAGPIDGGEDDAQVDSGPDACVAAIESCNDADDDCDSLVDEDVTRDCSTACGSGVETCAAGSFGACTPPPETCNGVDDDCNGTADDGFTCAVGASEGCATSCGTTGSRTCSASCEWGTTCTPPPEMCNGVDDNCDGNVDETIECAAGSSEGCTTSCGSSGSRTCSTGCLWGACMPPSETCNGTDDDCDGAADNGFTCAAGGTGTCPSSCGSTGTRVCTSSCDWDTTCTPPAEICNGMDDDCDGTADDGFACVEGSSVGCTTSCGSTGMEMCSATCTLGACMPPAEICSGVDDDCDGMADEGFGCAAGEMGDCTTSCGSMGTRVCEDTCEWGLCAAPAEICNGVDDDCDMMADDGFACVQGMPASCTTMCGSMGTTTCTASCTLDPACAPPAETCNGMDDDCDTMADDGFACVQGSMGPCMTMCGTTGTQTCSNSCDLGTCMPPDETCNDVDDDCDGMTDEGVTMACSTACGAGVRVCMAGSFGSCSAPMPGFESCNGLDDDCDGLVDDTAGCPCTLVRDGARTYLFCGAAAVTYATAQTTCASVGYDLVTIDSLAENTFLATTGLGAVDEDWWIGLTDRAVEDTFTWVSGSTSAYRNFGTGEPNPSPTDTDDCVYLADGSGSETRAAWHDTVCSNTRRFICEAP